MPKIKLDKLKASDSGVSQIVGTILLLAIAVVLFSALVVFFLSNPVTPSPPYADLTGSMEVTTAIIEHKGGESWELDESKVIVRLGDVEEVIVNFTNGISSNSSVSFDDINNNSRWDVGESLEIDCNALFGNDTINVSYWQIEVMIIDLPSNSIIMDSILQPGVLHTMPPVAMFDYDPHDPKVGKPITFNASRSYDPDGGTIEKYEWDFDDGSSPVTKYEPVITYEYSQEKVYYVKLTVYDDEGQNASIIAGVTIPPVNVTENKPPVANFTWTPPNPETNEEISFIDLSTDSDGSILNWTWDFGDGNVSYEKNPSYQYSDDGTYTVTLTIKDDDGATDNKIKQITVSNVPPTSSFTYSEEYTFFDNPTGFGLEFDMAYFDGSPDCNDIRSGLYVDNNNILATSHKTGLWWGAKDHSDYGDVTGNNTDKDEYDIYRSGDYIYCPGGDAGKKKLFIYNYNGISSPTFKASLTVEGEAVGVYVKGNYAYVTTGKEDGTSQKGLRIVDVSTPTSPSLLSKIVDEETSFVAVRGRGNYIYATDNTNNTLRIYNISDPTSPTWVATEDFSTQGWTGKIRRLFVADDGYVYVANDIGDLYIVDVSDSSSPSDIGSIAPSGSDESATYPGGDVFVIGDSAFVVTKYYIHWINVSDKSNPELVCTTYNSGYKFGAVYVYGCYVYAAAHDGLCIYRIVPPGGGGGPSQYHEFCFTDESTDSDGYIINWTWDFGDGNISYGQNATHSYSTSGTYIVNLTVRDNDDDTSWTTQEIWVSFPEADFSYSPEKPTIADTIQFTDNSSEDVVNWMWDFGDGFISYEKNPTHQYIIGGTYQVSLIVMDADGATDTISRNVTVSGGLGGNYIFALRGNDNKDFWRYDVVNNEWMSLAYTPDKVKEGGAVTYAGGYIYALRGHGSQDFWIYNLSNGSWTSLATTPAGVKEGGALTYAGGYIYALRGHDSQDFWIYNLSNGSWTSLADTPEPGVKKGGSLTYAGGYIYALEGKDKQKFWRYDISANSWDETLATTPAGVKEGGALVYVGGGGSENYIYALGGDSKNFWRYDISASPDSWEILATTPEPGVKKGGALTYAQGYIYAFGGGNTNHFWEYDVTHNNWQPMASAPATVGWGGALTRLFSIRTIYVDDDFTPSTPGWGIDHFNNIDDGMDAALDYDIIYVYNGNYSYLGINYLDVNKAVEIIGENRDSVILNGTGNDQSIVVFSSAGATLKNVTLTGSTPSGPCAIKVCSENTIIEYCNFTDLQDGILLDSSIANTIVRYNNLWTINDTAIRLSSNTNNNQVYNNSIWDCATSIYLYSGAHDNFIYNNVIEGGNSGIYLHSSVHSNEVYNNTVEGSDNGIKLENSGINNNIYNNTIHNNTNDGIYIRNHASENNIHENVIEYNANGVKIQSSSGINISNNTIRLNQVHGLMLTSATNSIICENQIYSNIQDGIYLSSSGINSITNNAIWNNQNGIHLISSGTTGTNKIIENEIYSNRMCGLNICSSESTYAYLNHIYSNANHGIYVNDSAVKQIKENQIHDNGENGIYLYLSSCGTGTSRGIINNNISSNNGNGIYLYSSNANDILTNKLSLNSGNGIYLYSCSTTSIENNNVSFNGNHGIYLKESSEGSSFPITYNNVWNNTKYGIYLNSSNLNHFTKNRIWNNSCGINISHSTSNEITENNISTNSYGIFIASSDCKFNKIFHNNFINNTLHDNSQAYDNGTDNQWAVSQDGNYWSEHTGTDADGNGKWDEPYSIAGGDSQDNYPWVDPLSW